jgi:hypothetical protein
MTIQDIFAISFIHNKTLPIAIKKLYKIERKQLYIYELSLLLYIYMLFKDRHFKQREIAHICAINLIYGLIRNGYILNDEKKTNGKYRINPIYINEIEKQCIYIYNRFLTPKYNKFLIDNQ